MKSFRAFVVSLVLLLLQIPSSAFAGDVRATEDLFSKEYRSLLSDDLRHVASAPGRWTETDWLVAGTGAGVVALSVAYLDEPLQDEIRENRDRTSDHIAHFFGPFGYEYMPILLGAFELSGRIFDDDRALATAHDGVAASLLATGLVTGSLKMAFGRGRPFDEESAHAFRPFSGENSFPSGHTTQSFAVAAVITEHYPEPWVQVVSYGTATMVAWSRLENDSHWLSDALAGALIGYTVGKTVVRFNKNWRLSPLIDGDTVGAQATTTF
jgi:membrane-associated phospholipid phosphatase